jgi:hypothetical protein
MGTFWGTRKERLGMVRRLLTDARESLEDVRSAISRSGRCQRRLMHHEGRP